MASPGKKPFLLRIDPEVLDAVQRWADDDEDLVPLRVSGEP